MYRVSKASITVAPRRPPALQTEQRDEAPLLLPPLALDQFAGAGTGWDRHPDTGDVWMGSRLATVWAGELCYPKGLLWRDTVFRGLTLLREHPKEHPKGHTSSHQPCLQALALALAKVVRQFHP